MKPIQTMNSVRGVALGLALVAGLWASAVQAQSVANGQTLYQTAYAPANGQSCQGCHGTPGGAGLGTLKINNGVDANKTKVASNGGVSLMAGFASMTDANFNDLAAYIASLQAGNPAPILVTTAAPGTLNNAGGGGCTLGAADRSTDPLWALMLGAAAFVLRRRLPLAKAAR